MARPSLLQQWNKCVRKQFKNANMTNQAQQFFPCSAATLIQCLSRWLNQILISIYRNRRWWFLSSYFANNLISNNHLLCIELHSGFLRFIFSKKKIVPPLRSSLANFVVDQRPIFNSFDCYGVQSRDYASPTLMKTDNHNCF